MGQNRYKLCKITVYSLLIFVAVIGNTMVCITAAVDEQLKKREEKLLNYSLATADFLVVLAMFCAISSNYLEYWPYGETMCRLWVALTVTSSSASIFNLCALSMSRFYSISRPFLYITKKNRLVAIGSLWLTALLLGFIDVFIGNKVLFAQNIGSTIIPQNSSLNVKPMERNICIFKLQPPYAVIFMMISFIIPTTIMLIFYIRLYICAEGHRRAIQNQIDINQYPLRHLSCTNPQLFHWLRHLAFRYSCRRQHSLTSVDSTTMVYSCKHRARKTLAIVVGTFMICWLPFNIICVYRLIQPTSLSELAEVLLWLGYANSAANPLIFWLCNKHFKRACQQLFSKICCCRQLFHHLCYYFRFTKNSEPNSRSVILSLTPSSTNFYSSRRNKRSIYRIQYTATETIN